MLTQTNTVWLSFEKLQHRTDIDTIENSETGANNNTLSRLDTFSQSIQHRTTRQLRRTKHMIQNTTPRLTNAKRNCRLTRQKRIVFLGEVFLAIWCHAGSEVHVIRQMSWQHTQSIAFTGKRQILCAVRSHLVLPSSNSSIISLPKLKSNPQQNCCNYKTKNFKNYIIFSIRFLSMLMPWCKIEIFW